MAVSPVRKGFDPSKGQKYHQTAASVYREDQASRLNPPKKTVAGVPARIVGEAGCSQPSITMDQLLGSAV